MNLDCVIHPETLLCRECGWKAPVAEARRNCPAVLARQWWRFGDRLAAVLRWLGITQERYERATKRKCGCVRRIDRLNAIGYHFAAIVRLLR